MCGVKEFKRAEGTESVSGATKPLKKENSTLTFKSDTTIGLSLFRIIKSAEKSYE
jgi:hypothetical protein